MGLLSYCCNYISDEKMTNSVAFPVLMVSLGCLLLGKCLCFG